ncbi:MAG: hypothetical protein JXR46_07975 [Calditrichaceae bacterium]|nr:hypothetical protein [Calditrichaceae bacterium]MBN2708966.1 hypothetical protein [Calditrichaceae bacterium]RQV97511.1 MAG: hypothetical protein EH224_00385 [Calditrichota bacterium]
MTILIWLKYDRLKNIRFFKILSAGFYFFLAGWLFSSLEGFFWESLLNISEHICYLIGSLLLAYWIYKISGVKIEVK